MQEVGGQVIAGDGVVEGCQVDVCYVEGEAQLLGGGGGLELPVADHRYYYPRNRCETCELVVLEFRNGGVGSQPVGGGLGIDRNCLA